MRSIVSVAACLVVSSAIAIRVTGADGIEDSVAKARAALARGDQDAAMTELASTLSGAPTAEAIELGIAALEAKGDLDTARSLAERALATAGSGAARTRAAFVRARLLAALGKREESLAAARTAVDSLRDPARRLELASFWLDLAKSRLDPASDASPSERASFTPDFESALYELDAALETEALGAKTDEARIERLRCLTGLARGGPERRDAAKTILAGTDLTEAQRAYVLEELVVACVVSDDPVRAAAAARELEALPDSRDRAIRAWAAIASAGQDESTIRWKREAVARLRAMNAPPEDQETALRSLAAVYAKEPAWIGLAIDSWKEARNTRPQSPFAAEIERLIADSLHRIGGVAAALPRLEEFLVGRAFDDAARQVAAHIEQLYVADIEDRDRTLSIAAGGELESARREAIAARRRFTEKYPANESVPARLLEISRFEQLAGDFDAAAKTRDSLRTRFPDRGEAQWAIVERAKDLAERKLDFAGALALLDLVQADSQARSVAESIRSMILEPTLEFAPTPVARSGEPVRLKLKCRNVGTAEISLYRVDLREFFLATGRFDVLATLDVSLIAAERTFAVEGATDDETSHRETIREVLLDAMTPGQALIASARAGNRESRSFVLCSDLDVAIVRTADELRAFGIDRKSGATKEVTLRAAMNGRLIPKDSEFTRELAPAALEILAIAENDLAIVETGSNLPQHVERSPVGSITIDRTVAQPGEVVRFCGFAQDESRSAAAKDVRCTVVVMGKDRLTLVDEFAVSVHENGRFSGEWVPSRALLSGDSAVNVELTLTTVGTTPLTRVSLASTRVMVGKFLLSQRAIHFEPIGTAPRAGSSTALTVRITDPDGVVRPDASVSVRVNDGDERTIRTDAAGRFVVEVGAEETRDRDSVMIEVSTAGEVATHVIPMLRGDTRLEISEDDLTRDRLVGEAVEFGLRLVADDERPVAGTVGIEFARLFAGRREIVSKSEVATDSSGHGKVALTLENPGEYELRLTHRDADDLPEERSLTFVAHAVDRSDADDVLLFADGSGEPGTDATVRAISPFDRTRALLVVSGSKLEKTEVVVLEKGVHRLKVPVPTEPVPYLEVRLIGLDRRFEAYEIVGIRRPFTLSVAAPDRIESESAAIETTITLTGARNGRGLGMSAFVAEEAVAARIEGRLRAGMTSRTLKLPTTVVTLDSSAEFEPAIEISSVDELVEQTLAEMSEVEAADAPVLVDSLRLEEMIRLRKLSEAGSADRGPTGGRGAVGGGGGGPSTGGGGSSTSYGGRSGKVSRRTILDFPPYAYSGDLMIGADSRSEWRVPTPPRPGRYRIVAFAIDDAGEIAVASHSFLHDPVLVGTLALAEDAGTISRPAQVVLSRRRPESATVDLSLFGDEANRAALSTRNVGLEGFGAASVRIDVPVGTTRGAIRCAGGPEWAFAARDTIAVGSELVISRGRPATIDAARRTSPGSSQASVHASPVTLLAALAHLPAGDDGEADEWSAFASAEAVRIASALPVSPDGSRPAAVFENRAREILRALRADLYADASRPTGTPNRPVLVALALDAMRDAKVTEDLVWFESLLETALAHVEAELVRAKEPNRRALPLWVLSRAGRAPYEKLNRLARDADALDARGLALLTLSLLASERNDEASAIRAKLIARLGTGDEALRSNAPASEPLASTREIAALIALAAPGDPRVAALESTWLSAIPLADPTGAAPLALLALEGKIGGKPKVSLRTSGTSVDLAFEGPDPLAIAPLSLAPTAADSGELVLDPGDGVLLATIPGAPPRVGPPSSVRATRVFARTTANRDGKEVKVGSSSLEGASTATIPTVDRLGVGRTYSVETRIELDDETRSFWWFEPRLPGVEIVESTLPGAYPSVTTPTGRFFLFDDVATTVRSVKLRYAVRAVAPGDFSAPASAVRFHRASESRTVDTGTSEYTIEAGDVDATLPPTPNEALSMGLVAAKERRFADAVSLLGSQLDALLDEGAALSTRNEVLRALLDASLESASDADIVRIFEIAKEQDPDHVLGFAAMDRVARAYAAIGEWERSRFVLSAIGDALFLQEARIVGRLESAHRDRLAVEIIERALAEHDVTPVTLETAFALGQHAAERARGAKSTLPADAPGLTRSAWHAVARRSLERFLAFAPKDPAIEEVSLTLANLLLDAGDEVEAERLASAAATRFASGRFTATWPYVEAFASLLRRDLDATIRHAERLLAAAEASKDPIQRKLAVTGRHMLAQAYHAKGDLAKARPLYEAIRDQVADARNVLAQLDRAALTAPSLVSCGAAAELVIPLERKGIDGDIEVSLYPVDLRLLYLKRRGFDDLASLELAGVTPMTRVTVQPTRDPSNSSERITLPPPGKGAYLAFLRCGDLHCRLIAIASDLAFETTIVARGARILAYDRASGTPRSDVLVTFVGSENERFVTRKTDLRGIAAADGLEGRLAVIAQLDGNYAFFQGGEDDDPSDPMRNDDATLMQSEQSDSESSDPGMNEAYGQLEADRARNDDVWKSNTNRAQQGVEIRRTKK